MINLINNTLQYIEPQIDITKSPLNRQLDKKESLINLAVYDCDSTLAKTVAVAATALFLIGPYFIPTAIGICAINAAMIFSGNIFLIAGMIVNFAIIQLGLIVDFKRDMSSIYKPLKIEKEILEALGGKHKFNKLPVLTSREIKNIHLQPYNFFLQNGDMNQIQPEHVHLKPITVGVNHLNCPFVCFNLKEKNPSEQTNSPISKVVTLYQKYHFPTHYGTYCDRKWDFESYEENKTTPFKTHIFTSLATSDSKVIRELVAKTHDSFELVEIAPAPITIQSIFSFSDLNISTN